jgi:hypothetical protein
VLFLDENCTNILIFSQSVIFDQKTAHFFHENAVLKKGHNQKMFGLLFSDSVYFSESKTTFGMFEIITFAVHSETHTLCYSMNNASYTL